MIEFKLLTLATLITTIFALQACGKKHKDDDSGSDPVVVQDPENDRELRLRGYVELSSIVETSMMNPGSGFSFQKYLGGDVEFFNGPVGLAPLMGYYSPDPANPGWRNVTANTVSTATNLIAFGELATDIARYCSGTAALAADLKDDFKNAILHYCKTSQISEGEWRVLWQGLTANLVADSEFKPWQDNLKSMESNSAEERIQVMVSTAMMSPSLLFKQ